MIDRLMTISLMSSLFQLPVLQDGTCTLMAPPRFAIGILLISPQGYHIPRSVRLAFFDHHRLTNNIVEYEACITGLETALDIGVRELEIHGDSNLVIQQTQGVWRTRD